MTKGVKTAALWSILVAGRQWENSVNWDALTTFVTTLPGPVVESGKLLVTGALAGLTASRASRIQFRRDREMQNAEHLAQLERQQQQHQFDLQRSYELRYNSGATQMGDSSPVVRIAGIHAVALLADEWVAARQRCVSLLCSYLRVPVGEEMSSGEKAVRRTLTEVLASHLKHDAAISWKELKIDLHDAVVEYADFRDCDFSNMQIDFRGCLLVEGGVMSFSQANLYNSNFDFTGCRLLRDATLDLGQSVMKSEIFFGNATLSGAHVILPITLDAASSVTFFEAAIKDESKVTSFGRDAFFVPQSDCQGDINFHNCKISKSEVDLYSIKLNDGVISFHSSILEESRIHAPRVMEKGRYYLDTKETTRCKIEMGNMQISGGKVWITSCDETSIDFHGDFKTAQWVTGEMCGGEINFLGATYHSGAFVMPARTGVKEDWGLWESQMKRRPDDNDYE